jgi:hypothetical protein
VITRTTLEKPNEYCLFFPMEKGGEIMLEEKRTIASYRLNSHTLLHFKKISKSITATQKSTQRLDKLLGTRPVACRVRVCVCVCVGALVRVVSHLGCVACVGDQRPRRKLAMTRSI